MAEGTPKYPRITFHAGAKPEDVAPATALADDIVQRGTDRRRYDTDGFRKTWQWALALGGK